MADNYLERQREAYEARKAEWLKSRRLGKPARRASQPAKPSARPKPTGDKE